MLAGVEPGAERDARTRADAALEADDLPQPPVVVACVDMAVVSEVAASHHVVRVATRRRPEAVRVVHRPQPVLAAEMIDLREHRHLGRPRLGGRSKQEKWILQAELYNEIHRWVKQTWAKGIDDKGRPMILPNTAPTEAGVAV